MCTYIIGLFKVQLNTKVIILSMEMFLRNQLFLEA